MEGYETIGNSARLLLNRLVIHNWLMDICLHSTLENSLNLAFNTLLLSLQIIIANFHIERKPKQV